MLSPIPVIEVPKNWNLFLFGDGHIGTRLRVQKAWNKLLDMMNSPYDGCKYNRGVDHGDVIDAIDILDPRFSLHDTKRATILAQMEMAFKEYQQIKDKLICILDGNHTFKKWNVVGDITPKICSRLGVLYGTYETAIRYEHKGKVQFEHYCHHGAGSIRSVAADPERRRISRLLSLKNKLYPVFGSTLLMSMGHTHRLMVLPPTEELYLYNKGGKVMKGYTPPDYNGELIHPDYRYYVNTGSFMTLHDNKKSGSGYAARAMYGPLDTGFAIAKIRNNKLKDIDEIVL